MALPGDGDAVCARGSTVRKRAVVPPPPLATSVHGRWPALPRGRQHAGGGCTRDENKLRPRGVLGVHGGTPYRGLRERRWGLGFVARARTILCRAVPNPSVTIRNFRIAARCTSEGRRGARP